jgi:hypothetical protein
VSSLALRPNKTVEKELANVGKVDSQAGEEAFCAPGAKPCDCILEDAFHATTEEDAVECSERTDPKPKVDGFHEFSVSRRFFDLNITYLLDEHFGLVAVIDAMSDHGHHFEEITLQKLDIRPMSGHRVLWVERTDTETTSVVDANSDDDSVGMERDATTLVTLCVIGDAKTATRCPLRDVPIRHAYEKTPPHGETADVIAQEAELTIADDGTATVKLVKGASDDQLARVLGPHKLW